jgi:hypothetical protein
MSEWAGSECQKLVKQVRRLRLYIPDLAAGDRSETRKIKTCDGA